MKQRIIRGRSKLPPAPAPKETVGVDLATTRDAFDIYNSKYNVNPCAETDLGVRDFSNIRPRAEPIRVPIHMEIMGMRVIVDETLPSDTFVISTGGDSVSCSQGAYSSLREAFHNQENQHSQQTIANAALIVQEARRRERATGYAAGMGLGATSFAELEQHFQMATPAIEEFNQRLREAMLDNLREMRYVPAMRRLPETPEPRVLHRNDTCHGCRFNRGPGDNESQTRCGNRANRSVDNIRCRAYQS